MHWVVLVGRSVVDVKQTLDGGFIMTGLNELQ
jgi:hypothetical protein